MVPVQVAGGSAHSTRGDGVDEPQPSMMGVRLVEGSGQPGPWFSADPSRNSVDGGTGVHRSVRSHRNESSGMGDLPDRTLPPWGARDMLSGQDPPSKRRADCGFPLFVVQSKLYGWSGGYYLMRIHTRLALLVRSIRPRPLGDYPLSHHDLRVSDAQDLIPSSTDPRMN